MEHRREKNPMAEKKSTLSGRRFPTTAGHITVNNDGIYDEAGEKVNEDFLVKMSQRAAKTARENADTGKSFEPAAAAAELANRGLQKNAESARDALFEHYSLQARAKQK